MATKAGEKYCGAHRDEGGASVGYVRCKLCNDLIAIEKMEAHLKKCNKVKEAAKRPAYYAKGINDEAHPADENITKLKLVQFDTDELNELLDLLKPIEDQIR